MVSLAHANQLALPTLLLALSLTCVSSSYIKCRTFKSLLPFVAGGKKGKGDKKGKSEKTSEISVSVPTAESSKYCSVYLMVSIKLFARRNFFCVSLYY